MDNAPRTVPAAESTDDRLSRLSRASLRINESLEFDTVLQEVLDSARSLTAARYGVMTLLDDAGRVQDFLASGMTTEEAERLWLTPDSWRIFEALTNISEPLRVPDLAEHVRGLGFTDFSIPLPVGSSDSWLRPCSTGELGWATSSAGGGLPIHGFAHVPPGSSGGPRLRGGQGRRRGVHPGRRGD